MDGVTLDPKHQSRQLTEGTERAAARAYLHGIGFDEEALAKPIIGVASTWTETMPCNFGLRALAAKVKEGIRSAGGTPMEFNTIAISDGITMGTSGMKTSLVSREVVADSIELVARGHLFDGIVALAACDKTIPGAVMALARLNVPGVLLYGGSILPGHYRGHDVTIADVFEAIGARAAGKISDADLKELEEAASPGIGACGGQFTANTMAMAFEVLGISPMGSAMVPAAYEEKNRVATEAGALIMDVLARGQRPRDIITRAGLENAIAAIATSGGSTNGVLHLLAIAREAGVELSIDDFDRIAARRRRPATSSRAAASWPRTSTRPAASRSSPSACSTPACSTRTRRPSRAARSASTRARPRETPGQEVVRPLDDPLKPTGGLAILRGNLAPEGSVVKLSGHERRHHRGPARVFENEEAAMAAVTGDPARRRRGDPQRGPRGRPRHARDARRHRRARRRGPGGAGRAAHRRPVLRRHARLHGRPRRARGARGRPDRRRPGRRHDHDRRRRAGGWTSSCPTTRSRAGSRPTSRRRRPTRTACSAKYAKLVSSASEGAVTR